MASMREKGRGMNAEDDRSASEQRVFKDYWRAALEENIDDVKARLIEATAATRSAWVTCPNCKHRHEVEVADIRARTDAAKVLHELAGERPKPASEEGGGGFILKRILVMPNGVERELTGDEP
jgi:hypothetical protein